MRPDRELALEAMIECTTERVERIAEGIEAFLADLSEPLFFLGPQWVPVHILPNALRAVSAERDQLQAALDEAAADCCRTVAERDAALARAEKAETALETVISDERNRIADHIEDEAGMTPCPEDAGVLRDCAWLVRADFSYDEAERLATLAREARP